MQSATSDFVSRTIENLGLKNLEPCLVTSTAPLGADWTFDSTSHHLHTLSSRCHIREIGQLAPGGAPVVRPAQDMC